MRGPAARPRGCGGGAPRKQRRGRDSVPGVPGAGQAPSSVAARPASSIEAAQRPGSGGGRAGPRSGGAAAAPTAPRGGRGAAMLCGGREGLGRDTQAVGEAQGVLGVERGEAELDLGEQPGREPGAQR